MPNEMIDVRFDLEGRFVPNGYALPLWSEVTRILPALEDFELAGILPLKGAASGEGLLLPRRAKLALRIPASFVRNALELSGKTLDIEGNPLYVGTGAPREIEAYPTLRSQFVASEKTETDFLEEIEEELEQLEISCKWICGRKQTLKNGKTIISGYSLAVHDLKPPASIRLQQVGLGNYRRLGCGIFVPHKTIAGLD